MTQRILVIGAVALGPKVACRIKRLEPEAQVTLIDKDSLISYGGCGIPYYIGGDIPEVEGLCSTSAHVLRDSRYFENIKDVRVRTRTEALSIDRDNKRVKVRNLDTGQEQDLAYDKLVIGTGASPFVPPIPGVDLEGVFVVSNLHQAKGIKDRISQGKVSKAVVIGGGAIGIEIAEALTDLWGIETSIVELAEQLLPSALGQDMAKIVLQHLNKKKVNVLLSSKVNGIIGKNNRVIGVKIDEKVLDADLVILSVGIRPNTGLAKAAGLLLGTSGGIKVDSHLQTSDPDIYAGGDCIEVNHILSGRQMLMPLGSLANRQGRIIGSHICGKNESFKGTSGAFIMKVFDLGVGRAGLTENQARQAGFDPVHSLVVQSDRAHFYPSMALMHLKLIADRDSRKVLGIECIGPNGDAVKARVDAVSAILSYGPDVSDIANLEVSYAPPFASAMDIVNNAANALENILDGRQNPIDADQFLEQFKEGNIRVLDVRSRAQAQPYVDKYKEKWINIDQQELRSRLSEVPETEPLYLVCGSGSRSYETQLMLRHENANADTRNIQGGIGMIQKLDPEFVPES